MSADKDVSPIASLPDGYAAVPIHHPDSAPVRLCVLVRRRPDPTAGPFVLLRDLPDAHVYLGCLSDAGGRIREWLELWVQNVDGLAGSLPAQRENLTNSVLDDRWAKQADSFRTLDPDGFLETGWETRPPLPIFLDAANQTLLHPRPAGEPSDWTLCRDDAALQSAGLPPYSTSLCRYLTPLSADADARFVPVTAGAPESSNTRPLAEILGGPTKVGLNSQGGRMMVLRFSPIPYDDFVDLLGGKAWPGLIVGKNALPLGGAYRQLSDWNELQERGAHLLLGRRGSAGRIVECFHLKLQLFTEAMELVRAAIAAQQLPCLNLSADSFRVRLQSTGARLPYFWTARATLVKPSEAYALPVESSDFTSFLRLRPASPSVYLPDALGRDAQGQGSVRIRQVHAAEQGRSTVEGTLVMSEPLSVSPRDLLRLSLPLASGRAELYGHIYSEEGLAPGEVRFRTRPQRLPEPVLKALHAAAGVPLPRAPFEIVPLMSSPSDLFSLAVLAARTFLVDEKNTLPVAVDELLSLAKQVGAEHDPRLPLGQRVAALFKKESRYAGSLGPHHLLRNGPTANQASALLPQELWFDTLGAILRLFPGAGPDSLCRDFGDAPALALETALNPALAEFEKLLVRSRSLIVIDWQQNREISGIIEKQRSAVTR